MPDWDLLLQYLVINPDVSPHTLETACHLRPLIPVKPMLAKATKATQEVITRMEEQEFTCEFKYDGERAQIHYVNTNSQYHDGKSKSVTLRLYSRNSENMTEKYPDIVKMFSEHLIVSPECKSFILDGEMVA